MPGPSCHLVRETYRRFIATAAFVTCVLKPGIALAVVLACPGQDITVEAPDIRLADRVCSVAAGSRNLLASCGLQQAEPYSIEISSPLAPEFEECFGVFHYEDNVVQVLDPVALLEATRRTGNFAHLPIDVLFDSLLVHEISHVLAYQSSLGPPRTKAEAEYIAYAMQVESLPAAIRNEFVAAHPVTLPVSLIGLNDIILSFAPEVFAVKAWTHFRTEGNGCEFIGQILKQRVNFPRQYTATYKHQNNPAICW